MRDKKTLLDTIKMAPKPTGKVGEALVEAAKKEAA